MVEVTVMPAQHSVPGTQCGQVCHGPLLALRGAGSSTGKGRGGEGRAAEEACLGGFGSRGMLQGWSAQGWLPVALPRGGAALEWTKPG